VDVGAGGLVAHSHNVNSNICSLLARQSLFLNKAMRIPAVYEYECIAAVNITQFCLCFSYYETHGLRYTTFIFKLAIL